MKTNERKKVIHIKSNVLENGLPKLPTSGSIEYGEIAVNYAASGETISIKNTNNEIVTFSCDNKINQKIDSAITIIRQNEKVSATAFNDLNERMIALNDNILIFSSTTISIENRINTLSTQLNNIESMLSLIISGTTQ